ncbi:methionine--tRNA ligase [Buchnera aphidicola (Nipponaphis monzeni)]|uniref:Methionine--tRNA ligase n=1 Tax=Buchnera aphidicola (Nipponaphis monzeni) TaxID=2495405 RepID=A0A455T9U6_9GAMM|nr:methionine--tRNA ligase [Buchnera aphidicola]BBI01106.1 methionine--tRNA ligase [Buchnera aphidicola (Nipponaphis monzeni)]
MTINNLKKMLVTCAFPYANGSIHLGHILEQVQADIWVRFQRMKGHELWFICADDSHGTAIMLKAQEENISPENLINKSLKEHKSDFIKFSIIHDNYHTTHSKENKFYVKKIYQILQKKKLIITKTISQFYDINKKIFLPDRFIKGSCPVCYAINQYGDHCDQCSSIYNAIDLIKPISILSKTSPILKKSLHLFFDLPQFSNFLKLWITSGVLQIQIINKIKEWFAIGLKQWNISRDAPYFGFKIPGYEDKYFYVWLDAPIGYISTFKNLCNNKTMLEINEYWNKYSKTELYHFIGKDIIYFHSLFWPAILKACSLRQPTKIFVHGYVTINGNKLSKSKGSLINANQWLKHLDSDSLRYYYASKLSSNIKDIEINLEDFYKKINSDIVNKIVNLASRCAKFINKYCDNTLSNVLLDYKIHKNFVSSSSIIEKLFKNREYNKAIREVIKQTNFANQYITNKSPWILFKDKKNKKHVHMIYSMGINFFKIIMTWLKPIIPNLSQKSENFLKVNLQWSNIHIPLLNHKISLFVPLYEKIDYKKIIAMKKYLNKN